MSVVTALSFVLVVGFIATGLVGFFGWRKRMREGAASRVNPDAIEIDRLATMKRHDLQGARL